MKKFIFTVLIEKDEDGINVFNTQFIEAKQLEWVI